MQIYKGFEQAKNETQIPVFLSGRTMESRYNPQRDAENLCNSIAEGSNFFLVFGIGSGIFIKLLSQKFPQAKIIALELYKEDIDFLFQNENVKSLQANSNIIFCSLDQLESVLTQNYIPARYGELKIIEQKAWINENSESIPKINSILSKTIGVISADYSVQSHFGKIWLTNILNNSRLAENHLTSFKSVFTNDNLSKTAVIVAAGPTLDKTLKNYSDKNKYFIIATDTAGLALIKKEIIPDIVVSIDGQAVSYNHFMKSSQKSASQPVCAFDLSANSSAARYVLQNGNKVTFFCSGHPLSTAINLSSGSPLPQLFSGAGTVTITAVDLAVQAGFQKIIILGADFSYSNGKAYASGTYLDSLYNMASSKLSDSEHTFTKLMFRTELKEISETVKTTEILEAYRISLEKYLMQNNIRFDKTDDVYILDCSKNNTQRSSKTSLTSDKNFSLLPFEKKLSTSTPEEAEPLLLPYLAWLRNNKKYKNYTYNELLKLAFNTIVRYNR